MMGTFHVYVTALLNAPGVGMRELLASIVHNCLAHPLLPIGQMLGGRCYAAAVRLHDVTAAWMLRGEG